LKLEIISECKLELELKLLANKQLKWELNWKFCNQNKIGN